MSRDQIGWDLNPASTGCRCCPGNKELDSGECSDLHWLDETLSAGRKGTRGHYYGVVHWVCDTKVFTNVQNECVLLLHVVSIMIDDASSFYVIIIIPVFDGLT